MGCRIIGDRESACAVGAQPTTPPTTIVRDATDRPPCHGRRSIRRRLKRRRGKPEAGDLVADCRPRPAYETSAAGRAVAPSRNPVGWPRRRAGSRAAARVAARHPIGPLHRNFVARPRRTDRRPAAGETTVHPGTGDPNSTAEPSPRGKLPENRQLPATQPRLPPKPSPNPAATVACR